VNPYANPSANAIGGETKPLAATIIPTKNSFFDMQLVLRNRNPASKQ
jgi:hypothetical protein